MPEIFRNIESYHLVESQKLNNFHHETITTMNSPYSSNDSPSDQSIESPMSSSSAYNMMEDDNYQLNFNENPYINLNQAGINAVELPNPEIVIIDQPVDKFRFRYKSEMMGTHGSLASINSTTRRKRHAPAIQLLHFPGAAFIRCTIVTKNEDRRIPHAHHLVKREGSSETTNCPYEIEVSGANNWIARFNGMGIIHTAKKHIKDELVKKMRTEALEKHRRTDPTISTLSVREETQIKMDAESAQKWMDLNSVALSFQAFVYNVHGVACPLTNPVYSHTINNLKSALTGELKISRIDKYASSCEGGDEVFLLVEKVGKKNIRIKFFEVDEKDNEIWSAYGRFSELDVHHQYAIVFRTPPYRDRDITSPREVYIQLERPTDGDCSEAIKFTYKPTDSLRRKRPRMSYSENIDLNNPISPDTTMSKNNFATPIMTSRDLSEEVRKLAEEKMASDEFQKVVADINIHEYLESWKDGDADFETDLCFDGVSSSDGSAFAMNILKDALKKSSNDGSKVPKRLKALLKERTTYGDTALHSALRHGQREVVKWILYIIGSSPQFTGLIDMQNASGKSPLHYAVALNQPDIVRALLTLGANPNSCDNHGSYVLHDAVKRPDASKCVLQLLEAKADYDLRDDAGWTPLQLAAEAGSLESFMALIKAGADVNSDERSFGRTALHIAVESGHIDLVKYILENTEVNVNQQNLGGNTALHTAVVTTGSRARELCKLLMEYGADPYISNGHTVMVEQPTNEIKQEIIDDEDEPPGGQTSFDLASGNDEIRDLFLDRERQVEALEIVEVKEEAKEETLETMTQWLDVDQIATLGRILEKNDGWKQLANRLGCDYLSTSLELSGASPALTILSYAEIQGDMTISKILTILHELRQTEATTYIEDIIRNQSRPH